MTPSIYAHATSGLIIFIVFINIILNFTLLRNMDIYKRMTILLLLSISLGIHGLSHLGLESIYNYDPLREIYRYSRA
jgi:hypothetical protein